MEGEHDQKSNEEGICFERNEQLSCFNAERILAMPLCEIDSDCTKGLCFLPTLNENERMMKITVQNFDKVTQFLFIGHPLFLHSAIVCRNEENFLPFIPHPYSIELLLNYGIAISISLAIFNSLPLYFLDGSFLISCIISLLFPSFLKHLWYFKLLFAIAFCATVIKSLYFLF